MIISNTQYFFYQYLRLAGKAKTHYYMSKRHTSLENLKGYREILKIKREYRLEIRSGQKPCNKNMRIRHTFTRNSQNRPKILQNTRKNMV